MLKQFKNGLCLWAFASVAFSLSACGIFVGGVDEEQNTVAGTNEENNASDPQIGYNPIDVVAPTDSGIAGDPGISIIDTLPPHNSEDPSHDITILPGTVKENQKAVKLYVGNNGASNASMELSLRDTVILIESGINGTFLINDLPDGTYSFVLKSYGSRGYVAETVYFLLHDSLSTNVLGPVPTGVAGYVDVEDLEAPPVQTVEFPPVVGMSPPVPGQEENPSDSSTVAEPPQDTASNNSDVVIQVPHELDYGLVYHWSGSDIPANESTVNDSLAFANGLEELTFEITFKINAFPETMLYNRNVFGKKGLFNLAIVNSTCTVQEPALAFFIGNGFNYTSCYDKAVVSSASLEAGKEITVTGVWDGKHVMLYKDGFLIAEQTLTKIVDINYITEDNIMETPFVFGGKDLDISIIDARLGNKAISSADVLYRHYLKGGAQ